MSHFVPAAPNTFAIVVSAAKDNHLAVSTYAVFAFEIKDGAERPWCLPVGLSEIVVDENGEQIFGVQLPDGSVSLDDRVFESDERFLKYCDDLFGLPAKRKAKARAEYDAREKKAAEQKAAKDLL